MAQLIPDPEFNDPEAWIIPDPTMAVIESGHLQLILCTQANRPRTPPLTFVVGAKYRVTVNISAATVNRDLKVIVIGGGQIVFLENPGNAVSDGDASFNQSGVNQVIPGIYVFEFTAALAVGEIQIGDRQGGFSALADATIESLYLYSADEFGLSESITESITESIAGPI